MKKINFIILAIFSIIIFSCNKEDSPENIPEIDFNIEQTYWEGKYISTVSGIATEYDIKITLKDEGNNNKPFNLSSYTIFDFMSKKEYNSTMFFNIDKKIISFTDSGGELNGAWWIRSRDNNQLILQQNLESSLQTRKLIINKMKI